MIEKRFMRRPIAVIGTQIILQAVKMNKTDTSQKMNLTKWGAQLKDPLNPFILYCRDVREVSGHKKL